MTADRTALEALRAELTRANLLPLAFPPEAGTLLRESLDGLDPNDPIDARRAETRLAGRWWAPRALGLWLSGARLVDVEVSSSHDRAPSFYGVLFLEGDEELASDAAMILDGACAA